MKNIDMIIELHQKAKSLRKEIREIGRAQENSLNKMFGTNVFDGMFTCVDEKDLCTKYVNGRIQK